MTHNYSTLIYQGMKDFSFQDHILKRDHFQRNLAFQLGFRGYVSFQGDDRPRIIPRLLKFLVKQHFLPPFGRICLVHFFQASC